MTSEELHWLAGWLEGEGTFYGTQCNTRKNYVYGRVTVRAVSTDLETVERAKLITGMGRIYGPYKYGTNKTDNYQWAVCRKHDAIDLMAQLRPLMSSRRQRQIDEALQKGSI